VGATALPVPRLWYWTYERAYFTCLRRGVKGDAYFILFFIHHMVHIGINKKDKTNLTKKEEKYLN